MAKILLMVTLTALQAMSMEELSEVHEEVKGSVPAPDATAETIIKDILEVADPVPDNNLPAFQNPPPPPPAKLKVGEFQYGDKTFKAIMPKVSIPGIGERTALEIAADEEAQAFLIKKGCVGSVIVEVE